MENENIFFSYFVYYKMLNVVHQNLIDCNDYFIKYYMLHILSKNCAYKFAYSYIYLSKKRSVLTI